MLIVEDGFRWFYLEATSTMMPLNFTVVELFCLGTQKIQCLENKGHILEGQS